MKTRKPATADILATLRNDPRSDYCLSQGELAIILDDIDRLEAIEARFKWMADSYGSAGEETEDAAAQCEAYEAAYWASRRAGLDNFESVYAGIDAALALAEERGRQKAGT
jgi:hypothetical protein